MVRGIFMRSPGATFDLRAALSEEIRAAINALDADPARRKSVRRCRLHLKRARALARVGHACAPGLAAVFNESARSVSRTLAQAHDMTAISDTARHLGKRVGKKQRATLIAVAEQYDAAREALGPLNLEVVRTGLKDLLALAQVWPEASARQIHKGAERIARRARKAHRRSHGDIIAPHRHEWRKREKDRLYAALLLGDAWPGGRRKRRSVSSDLAHALGRERDTLLLMERLEADPIVSEQEKAAKRALSALTARHAKLAKRADRLGVRVHAGRA